MLSLWVGQVDSKFGEDEMQAVFGMSGAGKGNRNEMQAIGGGNAQANKNLNEWTNAATGTYRTRISHLSDAYDHRI